MPDAQVLAADAGIMTADPDGGAALLDGGGGPVDAQSDGSGGPDGMGPGGGLCSGGPFALVWPTDARPILVKGGLRGAEGPVWVDSENALFFSEIHRDAADRTVDSASSIGKLVGTKLSEWIPASGSNGLALIKLQGQWQILAATREKKELSVFDLATKARTTYVDRNMNKPFHSPNDLVVRSDGTVYFSDPYWPVPADLTKDPMGVYRVSPADKAVTPVDLGLILPNGVSLSPDEKYLFVSSTDVNGGGRVTRYEVRPDGSTGAGTLFARTRGKEPDGMTLDCAGNLYVTSKAGVEVFSRPQDPGRLIVVGRNFAATNVAFGGMDHKTLFITSEDVDKAIYSITLNVPGLPY